MGRRGKLTSNPAVACDVSINADRLLVVSEVCSESLLVDVDNFTVYADLDHTRRDIQTAEAFMKGAFPQANFKVDTWGENHKEVREI